MTQSLDEILTADAELPLSSDLKGVVEAWLAHLVAERGQSAATREAYERDVRQLLSFLKSHLGHPPCLADLERLDARSVRAFLASRRKAGVASRSLARSLSALRTFFRWLEREDDVRGRGNRRRLILGRRRGARAACRVRLWLIARDGEQQQEQGEGCSAHWG